MSESFGCKCIIKDKSNWRVIHRMCNYSAFESPKYGPHPSNYSTVSCIKCTSTGRTKAKYVNGLEDIDKQKWLNNKLT